MDFATLIGLILAFAAVLGGYSMEGGSIDAVFLLAPILIVVGGTLGATMVTTSFATVLQVPRFLKLAVWSKQRSFTTAIEMLIALAEKARREGILALEPYGKQVTNPFFQKAVRLLVDGTEVTVLRGILETEIAYIEDRHKRGIVFFQKAGGFAPTLGILGTVLGLVHTLGNTSDAARMATAIAAAFIATLWGVGLANLFFLPIADKLRLRHEEEMSYLELIMEGIVAIQSGDNPRSILVRLQSFVAPHRRRSED